MSILFLFTLFFVFTIVRSQDPLSTSTIWINEINTNSEQIQNEFVEVAGIAGTDLTPYMLRFYNSQGIPFAHIRYINHFISNEQNGYGAFPYYEVPNPPLGPGTPLGIALIYRSTSDLVQFLSYGGTITANGGEADGITSIDVGVAEDNSPPDTSLGLTGTGSAYDDFTWTANLMPSPALLNFDQTIFVIGTTCPSECLVGIATAQSTADAAQLAAAPAQIDATQALQKVAAAQSTADENAIEIEARKQEIDKLKQRIEALERYIYSNSDSNEEFDNALNHEQRMDRNVDLFPNDEEEDDKHDEEEKHNLTLHLNQTILIKNLWCIFFVFLFTNLFICFCCYKRKKQKLNQPSKQNDIYTE